MNGREKITTLIILKIFHIYYEMLFSHNTIEGNSAICNNMDEPWEYYAIWNKSYKEPQILYDLSYKHNNN